MGTHQGRPSDARPRFGIGGEKRAPLFSAALTATQNATALHAENWPKIESPARPLTQFPSRKLLPVASGSTGRLNASRKRENKYKNLHSTAGEHYAPEIRTRQRVAIRAKPKGDHGADGHRRAQRRDCRRYTRRRHQRTVGGNDSRCGIKNQCIRKRLLRRT